MNGAGAGSLRETIIVQRYADQPDGQGGSTRIWAPLATLHAEIASLSGREAYQAQALRSLDTWDVTIRFRRDLSPKDRLLWRGLLMNIRSVSDPDGRRTWTVLRCESGVATA